MPLPFSCLPSILQYVMQLFLCNPTVGFLVVLLAAQPHGEEDQLLHLYTVLVTEAASLEHSKEGKSVMVSINSEVSKIACCTSVTYPFLKGVSQSGQEPFWTQKKRVCVKSLSINTCLLMVLSLWQVRFVEREMTVGISTELLLSGVTENTCNH